jgi:hypothetical protein
MFLKSTPRICQSIQLANTCTLKLMWHQWFSIHVGTTNNCEAPTNCVRILGSSTYNAMIWTYFLKPSMNSHWRGNWPPKPIEWQFNGHNPRLSLSPSISSYYRRNKMYPPKPQLRFLSEQLIPEAAACFLNPSHAYANASNGQIHVHSN